MDDEMRRDQREMIDAAIRRTGERIRHKLLVMSGKGGVGKSSVAVNLAVSLADRDFATGLLDVDLHGPSVGRLLHLTGLRPDAGERQLHPIVHAPSGLRVMTLASLLPSADDAVIWRGPRKTSLIRQFLADVAWGDLDFLVIDSPPGTGDEPMSVLQSIPDARAVVVTTPQELAVDDVRRSIMFCRSLDTPVLGVIENMSGFACPHCGRTVGLFGAGGGQRISEEKRIPFLGRIPFDPEMVTCGDTGQPCVSSIRESPAARAMDGIVDRVLAALGERAAAPGPSRIP